VKGWLFWSTVYSAGAGGTWLLSKAAAKRSPLLAPLTTGQLAMWPLQLPALLKAFASSSDGLPLNAP